ncbi:unnamed protein product, partial [Ectocarpus sp. 8 AP-2014]
IGSDAPRVYCCTIDCACYILTNTTNVPSKPDASEFLVETSGVQVVASRVDCQSGFGNVRGTKNDRLSTKKLGFQLSSCQEVLGTARVLLRCAWISDHRYFH